MINKTNTLCENTADINNQKKYADRVSAVLKEKTLRLGRPLKVFVQTFGCQQNEADSERLLGTAISLGYEKSDSLDNADLIIYNTCAVREHAELKALSKTGQLKHIKAKNPELVVGLWGCMVSQEHRVDDIKNKYPYVDFVAGTNMLHRLPEILCDVMTHDRRRYYVDDEDYSIVEGVPVTRENDLKAWLSIMYGCNNFCTYCVVPYVRGRERSRKAEDIIAEAKELVAEGYKEITLLGQNVNSYGKNTDGPGFAELLKGICEIEGDFWVRFMTSHPKDVSDELIEVIKNNDKVAKHFHLPVQSGSNRILKLMNRNYTRERYLELVEKLRKAVPDITLTTDIIVGFPDETEADFVETLDIINKVGFDSIYSFIYSKRKGTPAEKMQDPYTYEQKTERFARLMDLHHTKITEINKGYIGKTIRVLCETENKENSTEYSGRCTGNKLIKFTAPAGSELYGKFVNVKITKAGDVQLYGEMVTE